MRGARLVGALLRLYPRDFRARYGDEMREAYRAQRAALRGAGPAALLRLWLRTTLGMITGAVAERRGGGSMGATGGVDTWRRELGQAARRLRRAPGFTVLAVATLAAGTGAFTAVFSVVESVLLEPLPYEGPDELAWVWRDLGWMGVLRGWLGSKEVEYLREHPDVEGMLVTRSHRSTLAGLEGTDPRDVRVIAASSELLEFLGVPPLLGRGFRAEDAEPGAQPVLLLRHDLWQSAFGGDPGAVGRTVSLGGEPAQVVGVLPPRFDFRMHSSLGEPLEADLYTVFQEDLTSVPAGAGWLGGLVRFRDGPESPPARAALQRVTERVTPEIMGPDSERIVRLWAAPIKQDLVGDLRAPLTAVLAAAGFLLLILAANLGTLFISRGAMRQRDMAVRSAIGGSGRAVARSVVAEALLMAAAGAAAAVAVAWLGVDVLARAAAEALPRSGEIALDGTGVAVAAGLAAGLALLAALPSTLRARSAVPSTALREAAGAASAGRSRGRDVLVVAQVALSLVLLVGTGLLARSMAELLRVDPGFDPSRTLTFRVGLGSGYDDPGALAFERTLRDELGALPGVQAVGVADALPLGLETNQGPVIFPNAPGNTGDPQADRVLTDLFFSTPGYVEAAGLRLLDGRDFLEGEGGEGPSAALIDDVLAGRFFPGGGAVGSRLVTGADTATIVGVVDQARFYDLRADDRGQVFLPNASNPRYGLRVAVRVERGDPMALMPAARAVVARLDGGLAVSEVRTLEGIVTDALGQERLNLGLVSAFALAALLLSGLGVYGVVATTVVRRRPEIGVRMALGAEGGAVARMVLTQGVRLVAIGALVGLAGAWAASRLLASLLYGVAPGDPVTFVAVSALLVGVGAAASWLPARRATRVDPVEALRAG